MIVDGWRYYASVYTRKLDRGGRLGGIAYHAAARLHAILMSIFSARRLNYDQHITCVSIMVQYALTLLGNDSAA